jgi:hypothetical protein
MASLISFESTPLTSIVTAPVLRSNLTVFRTFGQSRLPLWAVEARDLPALNNVDPRLGGRGNLIGPSLRNIGNHNQPAGAVCNFRLPAWRENVWHRVMRLKLKGDAMVRN